MRGFTSLPGDLQEEVQGCFRVDPKRCRGFYRGSLEFKGLKRSSGFLDEGLTGFLRRFKAFETISRPFKAFRGFPIVPEV